MADRLSWVEPALNASASPAALTGVYGTGNHNQWLGRLTLSSPSRPIPPVAEGKPLAHARLRVIIRVFA